MTPQILNLGRDEPRHPLTPILSDHSRQQIWTEFVEHSKVSQCVILLLPVHIGGLRLLFGLGNQLGRLHIEFEIVVRFVDDLGQQEVL